LEATGVRADLRRHPRGGGGIHGTGAVDLDAVRQFGVEPAMQVAALAAERQDRGVVALGIGGSEERGPAHWSRTFSHLPSGRDFTFTRTPARARAGSMWDALALGANASATGLPRCATPGCCATCERGTFLWNLHHQQSGHGVVERLEDHPVGRLFDAGVPIVLNSDDPAMFRCTLAGEYRLAAERFGFTEAELRRIAENGFRYAFDWR